MARDVDLLQGLLRSLRGWSDAIRRATNAVSVDFIPTENGEFLARVVWKVPDGERSFERTFTRQYVFGKSYGLSPQAWRVERRPCHHARDIMREVLAQRGVL